MSRISFNKVEVSVPVSLFVPLVDPETLLFAQPGMGVSFFVERSVWERWSKPAAMWVNFAPADDSEGAA